MSLTCKHAKALLKELEESAKALLENHVQLVLCGDCGNWDVEQEPEVITLRATLKKIEELNQ